MTIVATVTASGVRLAAPLEKASARESDLMTVETSVAALKAENPGATSTVALLLGTADHGPFLNAWPNGSPNYALRLNPKGVLLMAVPSSAATTLANPKNCDKIRTNFAIVPR